MPSIRINNVFNLEKVRSAFPSTLRNDSLIALTNRSQYPPRHDERSVMNFHVIPFDESSELIRFRSNVSHTVRL